LADLIGFKGFCRCLTLLDRDYNFSYSKSQLLVVMSIESLNQSQPKISDLLNRLTHEEVNRLTGQNLKFIERLSPSEIKELCGNNLQESLDRDLKAIESRLNLVSKFLNF